MEAGEQKATAVEDLKLQMKKADQASRDKIKAMENKIDELNIEVKRAKDMVNVKNDEIEHLTT